MKKEEPDQCIHTLIIGSHETDRAGFINRLLAELKPCPKLYGYRSVKEAADETGNAPIYIYPSVGEHRQTPENLVGWCKEQKFTVDLNAFERNAFLVEIAQPDGLLILDEIGSMESQAPRFSSAILAALDGAVPILASVRDIDIPFLDAVRNHPKAHCFILKADNVKTLFPKALAHLRAQLKVMMFG